jgi:nuclear cap-binding protein subunit 1
LDTAIATLRDLSASDFAGTTDSFPQPFVGRVNLPADTAPFELPSVLVPPDVEEADEGEEVGAVKKEEWAEYYVRLFDNDVRLFHYNSNLTHTSQLLTLTIVHLIA